MRLSSLTASDFYMRIDNATTVWRACASISGARFTRWEKPTPGRRTRWRYRLVFFSLIWVQHRHAPCGKNRKSPCWKRWGELRGPLPPATPMTHNSGGTGTQLDDMALAANTLIQSGGGMALVQNGT